MRQLITFIILASFTTACAIEDQSTNDPTATEQSDTSSPNVSTASQSVTGTWVYSVRIMTKPPEFYGVPLVNTEHSALLVRVTSPSGFSYSYATCNEGTCADQPSMSSKCQMIVTADHELPRLVDKPCNARSIWGKEAGRHLCNDHTVVQYNKLVHGYYDFSTCVDSTPRVTAPDCN